ncbi:RagB/SusD family nutrient uptake outer membrane protein [Pedobacter frigidisoli]|uniref:RagB/SusD family nutrient uptake outer membrane protein n=1 Tax=Pedobacter frigidisoli TaxID=2530455 RepID=A0A4R0NZ34_9SPHI|nr:RagB/SusD family nutrient uptake outer membrane protein [Pedobacter frigidisoli]TCD05938.1 RagB/SusD family nutrient uptake outer membrane protein [Pedobacter frigidisoli]
MKNKSRYLLALNFCAMFMLTLNSCRKFIEIPPPANSIVTDQIFADSANATAAINGIYINMMNAAGTTGIANSLVNTTSALSADEMGLTTNLVASQELLTNVINPTNSTVTTLWNSAYTFIYQANACIEGVDNSTTLGITVGNRITGEAKFIRAFLNFYMVNLYGAVPLVLTTDYKINGSLPRVSVEVIYKQIDNDLKDAQALLANDTEPYNKLRVNRFAVAAFMARVQLYEQQWAAAEASATMVINASYKIEPTLNNVFLVGNQEEIWQMSPPAPGDETTEGQLFIPSSATSVPAYIITTTLLNAFEANDLRKTQWITSATIGTNKYFYPYKYKLRRDNLTVPKEGYSMLRLAEQYLIRAEARAQQNNLSGAVSDINVIRKRAGLPNIAVSNQANVLTAIQHERQTELFCEWGHRWLDLKRTKTINTVLTTNKPGWKPAASLFPVPYTQLQLNPFLNQNPGY